MRHTHPIATEVLKFRGKKSYGLIARELGITRNKVAGIIFRANHPIKERRAANPEKCGSIGTGYNRRCGSGYAAPLHLPWKNRFSEAAE